MAWKKVRLKSIKGNSGR